MYKKNNTFILSMFFVFFFLGCFNLANASSYYVSNTGSDSNNGTSTATPWKTITKVNSATFLPGDNILFNKGDTFYGSITVSQSGTASNPITFSSYGTGNKPIITGFTNVTDWTNLGNNIWESTNPVSTLPTVNMVTVNGVNTAMGRWPNADATNGGYATFQSHSGSTSITSSSLTGTPNWTGAELVIRTTQYWIERTSVNSQSSGTLTYSPATSAEPKNNFGFFIQNDPRTLDQQNEWYYNKTTHKIQMYSTSQPTNVRVASVDILVLPQANYINFNNIAFQGANKYSFFNDWGIFHDLNIENCDMSYSGIDGIKLIFSNLTIENSTISDSNSVGINLINNNINTILRNNTIQNTAIHPGMGQSGFGAYYGIYFIGNGLLAEYNKVINTGYVGIFFTGSSNILIKNNVVDTYCTILQDGGGIYTYVGSPTPIFTNRIIENNIVLNGIGAVEGTDRSSIYAADGIYLDGYSMNVDVIGNTVTNSSDSGIYINSNTNGTIENNTVYNNGTYQIGMDNFAVSPNTIKNITINNNIFFAKNNTQNASMLRSRDTNFNVFGTFDNNYYVRPINDNNTIYTYSYNSGQDWPGVARALEEWKTLTGQDQNSKKSPITISSESDLQFEYNATQSNKTITLTKPMIDVAGTKYTGSVTLLPYTSIVLMPDTNTLSDTTPPIISSFTIPSTSSSLTVPISTFTATDTVGVTGYLLTETSSTPSPASGSWSSTPPSTYTFSTAGSKTLYAWAKDVAGNVSASVSRSVTITLPVTTYTLTYTANANGTLTGITTQTVNSGSSGTAITAVPNAGYRFVSWSDGSTANPRTDTNVTANKSVSATFTLSIILSDTTPPVISSFVIPTTSSSLTINFTAPVATDAIGVTGYKLTESATAPLASDTGWTTSAPTTYTFSSGGSKTLYAWAKDVAGNVSTSVSDSVVITITSGPSTYYISPSGSNSNNGSTTTPWQTLSYACSQATISGDIIHVKAGTYIETTQCILAVGVSIEGEGNTSIIKSHISTLNVWTILASSATEGTNGNQHISNIKMDGDALTAFGAISVLRRSNVEIYNSTFIDFNYYGVGFDGGGIPPTTYATGNKFHDNTVTNCSGYFPAGDKNGGEGKYAVGVNGQDGLLIYNNNLDQTSRSAGSNGYLIKGVSGYVKNVKIHDNIITKAPYDNLTWDFAVELWHVLGGVEIYNNVITAGIDIVLSSKGSSTYSAWIHNNTIGHTILPDYSSTVGIFIEQSSSDVIIEKNIIKNVSKGIHFTEFNSAQTVNNIRINNNVFYNIGTTSAGPIYNGYGIDWSVGVVSAISNLYILNNTFIGLGTNKSSAGIYLPTVGNVSNVFIRNNIITNFYLGPINVSSDGTLTFDYVYNQNNCFYGNGNNNDLRNVGGVTITNLTTSGNLKVDPLFVSTTDYHLQSGSPAINTGTNVGLTTDYAGNPIVGLPDIGAYESNYTSINTYTLTYTANANGTLTGTTTQVVNANASGTAITAVPNAGYRFVSWSDGSTTNPRTDTNVTANKSVSATFTINTNTHTLYYIDSQSGNDSNNGTSTSTPWKTIEKVNASTFLPGSSILFKKGDTFYGKLIVARALGTSDLPITYSTYGTGENPKITGYTTLTSWTDEGGGIYSTPLNTGFYLNNVSVNDTLQPMGRYPNTGWRTYTSHSDNTSITDATLTGSWTGAEVVIRKNKWVIDRHAISSGNNTTLVYTTTSDYLATLGNTEDYSPTDGNGYFIQNSLATLDTPGEWYYDSTAHKLYIYSGTIPSNVKASTSEKVLDMYSSTYIDFVNIDFEGANTIGLSLQSTANHITFKDSNITMMGGYAVHGYAPNITFDGGKLDGSNSRGLAMYGNNVAIKNYAIGNIGMKAGMMWSAGGGSAVNLNGADSSIINSSIINTGYNAISFGGINTLVENNFINNFCVVKDDGGGIYTYGGTSDGSKVSGNIIINGIGAYEGSAGSGVSIVAAGIYSDNLSDNIEISGNTVANSNGGINLNEANTLNIHNNALYNNLVGLKVASTAANPTHDITFRNNIVSKNAELNTIVNNTNVIKVDNIFSFFSYPSTYFSIGSINSNYYMAPSIDSSFLFANRNYYNGAILRNFSDWKLFSGYDTNSTFTGVLSRLEYNATTSNKTISLSQPMIDVTGAKYTGSVTLLPYTSIILIPDTSPVGDTTAPVISSFVIPATATSLTINFTAPSVSDNIGVTGYLLTETSTTPSPASGSWSSTPPSTYTFSTAGSKTLYLWAKDATGNVSASVSRSVTITLSVTTYTLTYTANTNGTLTGTATQTVNSGSSGTAITAVPNAGYRFVSWSDGSIANPRTDTNVTANKSVSATFTLSIITTYTLTLNKSGTGNGTVSGAGIYNQGTIVTAIATASTGSTLTGWSGDCSTSGVVTMNANKICTATFAVNTNTNTYTINSSTASNGTISPLGTTTKNYATSQIYTITPSSGYHIESVSVDGVYQGTAKTYTFTNISANHIIVVTFAKNLSISSITATATSTSSITVTWVTSENSSSQVEYGTSNHYGMLSQLDSTLSTFHSVVISNLKRNTNYHYRVKSIDISSNLVQSTDKSRKTLSR